MNGNGGDAARLRDVDEVWLEAALREVLADEAPPDLRARLAAASPARAAAAAANVDGAAGPRATSRWWAAAVVWFGVLVVGGVAVLQRTGAGVAGAPAAAPQQPSQELEVADLPGLVARLPLTTTLALTALHGPDGARLPSEPEHSAIVLDPACLPALRAALGPGCATGAPFALREVQAELRLSGEDGFVRLRLAITAETVRVGAAKFACTAPLPTPLAGALRDLWRDLAARKPPARQRIQVHTQRELVAALGSDRTLELVGGPFVLTGSDDDGEFPANPAVEFRDPSPLPFLVVKGVRNLRLCGVGGAVRLLGKSPADVVHFEDCVGVSFEDLVLGHDTGVAHFCSAPVLTLQRCRDIALRDCELFGCGTEGLVAEQVQGLRMERGEIHTCRNAVLTCRTAKDVSFLGTVFRDCTLWQPGFVFEACEKVLLADCSVRGLDGLVDGTRDGQMMFLVTMDEAVQFERGRIRGNRVQRIANSKLLLVRRGTDEGDNGPDQDVAPREGGR